MDKRIFYSLLLGQLNHSKQVLNMAVNSAVGKQAEYMESRLSCNCF